jgi:hypothetical protein
MLKLDPHLFVNDFYHEHYNVTRITIYDFLFLWLRSRSKKIKEAEKMHLKRFDTHGSKGLNGHLFGNQYMKDDDGGGSFSSRRSYSCKIAKT